MQALSMLDNCPVHVGLVATACRAMQPSSQQRSGMLLRVEGAESLAGNA